MDPEAVPIPNRLHRSRAIFACVEGAFVQPHRGFLSGARFNRQYVKTAFRGFNVPGA
jgi:hypothetical protein